MTSTLNESTCCLISFFYIKPQRYIRKYNAEQSCLISFFYIKPQPGDIHVVAIVSCLISFFYIKPQLILIYWISVLVVLYPSSTSNHNVHWLIDYPMELSYILLLHQTTTKRRIVCSTDVLSYILLLHQTTTPPLPYEFAPSCLISFFYIKPQQNNQWQSMTSGCLISFFYIKPQRILSFVLI